MLHPPTLEILLEGMKTLCQSPLFQGAGQSSVFCSRVVCCSNHRPCPRKPPQPKLKATASWSAVQIIAFVRASLRSQAQKLRNDGLSRKKKSQHRAGLGPPATATSRNGVKRKGRGSECLDHRPWPPKPSPKTRQRRPAQTEYSVTKLAGSQTVKFVAGNSTLRLLLERPRHRSLLRWSTCFA